MSNSKLSGWSKATSILFWGFVVIYFIVGATGGVLYLVDLLS